MDYHLFKKLVTKKNGKKDKQWYYWFYGENGVRRQRSCKGCSIKAEAERYINQLPPVSSEKDSCFDTTKSDSLLIATITEHMYLPDSDHFQRRKQIGKDRYFYRTSALPGSYYSALWTKRYIDTPRIRDSKDGINN
ncbi:MAG: hypothetical protein LBR47_03125 [Spirochaetaceae bacterium]|nr:hypothetical protein [Spirochaetaceae bacterium]